METRKPCLPLPRICPGSCWTGAGTADSGYARYFGYLAGGSPEEMIGGFRPTLLVLLGTVALVLLLTCANVGILYSVRLLSRQREIVLAARRDGSVDVSTLEDEEGRLSDLTLWQGRFRPEQKTLFNRVQLHIAVGQAF